jgi:PAS domain S-box-containing protein
MACPQCGHDEQLRLILDNVADLIAILDAQGRRIYNSPSYHNVLGDPKQLQGTDSFGEVHPDDRVRLRQTFDATIQSGAGRRSEYRFVRKDGEIRYIESQSDVIRNAQGRPDKVVVVSRDITERKRAEEEIRTAYQNLQAMQSDLVQSEKLASIGQFAAGIVHDLKNPLAVIANGAELLRRMQDTGAAFDERSNEILELVENQAQRAAAMVHGLLNLARREDLALAPGDLHEVIKVAVSSVRHAQLPPHVDVSAALAEGPARVLMDPSQMEEVLVNLMTNAVQALPPAGGSVQVRTALIPVPGDVAKSGARAAFFSASGRALVVEVADTGSGIPEESLKKIFEPFYTTKPKGQGTGLGLAIVRAIVEQHHGLIAVTSRVGHGTTFRITLPVPRTT